MPKQSDTNLLPMSWECLCTSLCCNGSTPSRCPWDTRNNQWDVHANFYICKISNNICVQTYQRKIHQEIHPQGRGKRRRRRRPPPPPPLPPPPQQQQERQQQKEDKEQEQEQPPREQKPKGTRLPAPLWSMFPLPCWPGAGCQDSLRWNIWARYMLWIPNPLSFQPNLQAQTTSYGLMQMSRNRPTLCGMQTIQPKLSSLQGHWRLCCPTEHHAEKSKGLQIARILHDFLKLLRHQLQPKARLSQQQATNTWCRMQFFV